MKWFPFIHRRREGERFQIGLNYEPKSEFTDFHVNLIVPLWVSLRWFTYRDFCTQSYRYGGYTRVLRIGLRRRGDRSVMGGSPRYVFQLTSWRMYSTAYIYKTEEQAQDEGCPSGSWPLANESGRSVGKEWG